VQYQPLNLLDAFIGLGSFDIIFCRNVLIYFDEAMKRNILERMALLLPADGYLLLGAAETVVGITTAFSPIEAARGVNMKPAPKSTQAPKASVA